MTGDATSLIFYLLVLILPLSALAARRLPAGRVVKLALAWIAIFAVGALIMSVLT